MSFDDPVPTAETIAVWRAALVWLATHEGVSIAAARRAQRVAANALYRGMLPEETLAKKDPEE